MPGKKRKYWTFGDCGTENRQEAGCTKNQEWAEFHNGLLAHIRIYHFLNTKVAAHQIINNELWMVVMVIILNTS